MAAAGVYDVVIAGASFAGLAVARAITAPGPVAGGAGASLPAADHAVPPRPLRVLLVDARPVGDGVTSACAAPVSALRMMGAERSILQVHDVLLIHTPGGRDVWLLPEPFCTFDYRRFCRDALSGARVEVRVATVRGRDGQRARTSAGDVEGRVLIDATGPRAALAGPASPRRVAFGIESEIPRPVEPGLHFYFVPEIRDGYAWAFPAGAGTRFGVLSYRGRTKLFPALRAFMARFGARPDGIHGGFLATGWTPGVVDGIFTVGDAAGHCLPVSGEGIRTAIRGGARCGALVRQALEGSITVSEARRAYAAFVARDRRRYRGLLVANGLLLALPQGWLRWGAAGLARPRTLRWFFGKYLGIFDR